METSHRLAQLGRAITLVLVVCLLPGTPTVRAQEATPDDPTTTQVEGDAAAAAKASLAPLWIRADIGIIGIASEAAMNSAIAVATARQAAGVLLVLDSPGGSLESTRNMVKTILAADIPIVVWVGPSGARAGSAGAFITLAGHVAAMAPGTNIGAAHPVEANGDDIKGDMKKKVENDTVAFMESIAKMRGRNREMAISFVEMSTSINAQEALDHSVIDIVAPNERAVLEQVNGRSVALTSAENRATIASANAEIVVLERTLRQKVLEVLSNPNLFYLLFTFGLLGIGFEITHPGVIFPGVIGAISLLLALMAQSVLPVSAGSAALMALGAAFIVAEIFVPSFGILGIGGAVAFVLGSIFLVDPDDAAGLRVSLYLIAPSTLMLLGALAGAGWLVLRSRRAPKATGSESMIGRRVRALDDFSNGEGHARIDGELWRVALASPCAEGAEVIRRGDELKIANVIGTILQVERSLD